MKKSYSRFWSFLCLFLMVLACTKDVGLITEVEFQLLEQHTADGFVNQGLPTTFTIVPEAELEGYEYDISYEVLEGSGYFEDVDGNRLEAGKGLSIPPLTTSWLYVGTETGEHRLKILAADNFGMSEEIEILYNLKNVPARWQATSDLTEIELGKSAGVSILFEIVNTTLDVSYQARYEFASGAGTLVPVEGGTYEIGGAYNTITPGTYGFDFTPEAVGDHQIVFILRDSNGQELKTEVVFNVVQFIEVIAIDLGEHDEIGMQVGDELECPATFTPSNATDQGITLVSSDPDVVLIDENNICIALSVGTATVTVTSTSNPDATDSVLITVTEADRVPVTAITVSQEDPTADGATRQLLATVLPANATDPSVTWSSSDDSIAEVDENGLLSGLTSGSVTITATSVSDPDVTGVILIEITGGPLQSGTDITSFELPVQNSASIDVVGHTVTVNVTEGTELNVAPQTLMVSQGATVSPGVSVVRDFNTSVEYTITAENGAIQLWTVNVTVSPLTESSENDITAFELPVQNNADIDNVNHTITVNVAAGTDVNVAPSILDISPNATITPTISSIQDFNAPVNYTVRAENGEEQVWTVNVTVAANQPPVAVDDTAGVELGQTVTINVVDNDSDQDTPKSELVISGVIGVQPANAGSFTVQGQQIVFTSSGDYTGEATFGYTINDGNAGNDDSAIVTVTIVETEVLITGIVLVPTGLILDVGQTGQLNATVSPDNPTDPTLDWTSSNPNVATASSTGEVLAVGVGTATVTASSNDSSDVEATASVTVNNPVSSAKSIDSFEINGVSGTINGTNIAITLPFGTNVTTLFPIITFTGQSINPASGAATDFTNTVTYTVIAEDNSTIDYNVIVTVATSSTKSIDSFTINGVQGIISGTNIGLTLPFGTDLTSLSPVIAFTGQSIDPASGTPTDFTNDVTYTVTAEDNSTIDYTVTVNLAANSAKSIDSFTINGVQGIISGTNIGLTLPFGTNVTSLSPVIAFTGQSIDPTSGTPTDFTNNVTYTVTAEDDSTIAYTVTVNVAASSAKSIDSFTINGVQGIISGTNIGLTLPFGTNVTSLSPVIAFTGQSVSPASGTPTDFTNNVTYTVSAEDNSTIDYTVTVAIAANSAKSIDSFTINGFQGIISGTNIGLILPAGTNLTSLSPVIAFTGQSINPVSGAPTDFTNAVTYTVTAEDNSTLDYSVTVTAAPSSAKSIDSFIINGVQGSISGTNISLTLPFGTDVTSLSPVIVITGESINPASGTATDFTNDVIYTVTAEDNSTLDYTVTIQVAVDPRSDQNDITNFVLPGQVVASDINQVNHTVTAEVPFGTNLNVVPLVLTVSDNATINPLSTEQQNFASPITYTVTAENGSAQNWEVTVLVEADPRSDQNDITAFAIPGQITPSTIDIANHTVTANVPFGTNLNTIPLVLTVSDNATVNPPSANQQNFASPVTYTVTAENGDPQDWEVTVNVGADPRSSENDILQFILSPTSGEATINTTNHTAITNVPFGTDLTVAPVALVVSDGASVSPAQNVEQDFSSPVTYTVTAENGETQDWMVIVNEQAGSPENDITQFTFSPSSGNASINITNHTAITQVPFSTNLLAAPTNLVVSPNATVSPLGNVERDFSSPVNYTVTAQDGTPQDWTVIVNAAPQAVINQAPHSPASTERRFAGVNSTDPNGDNLTYEWAFKDNLGTIVGTALGTPAIYDFGSAGNYEVELTVDDGRGGEDTASISVVVEEPVPMAEFSNGTSVSPGLTFVTGTLTISHGPVAFRVVAFGGSGNFEFESNITFEIVGQGTWFAFAQGEDIDAIDTPLISPGTYTYNLSGSFAGSSGNGGSVSAISN